MDHCGALDAVLDAVAFGVAVRVGHQALAASLRSDEADDCRAARRASRVDPQPDEADKRLRAWDPAGEGFLVVAHASLIDVGRPEDRQEPACKSRLREAEKTRPVALLPAADEDCEAGSVAPTCEDLAAVGDVERERLVTVEAQGLGEREVVGARARERGSASPTGVPERTQKARDSVAASVTMPKNMPLMRPQIMK